MKHAAAKNVPKLLNFEQKQCCMDIAQEMLTTFNDDSDLLKNVITDDESLFLFPKLKTPMKEKRFRSVSRIGKNAWEELQFAVTGT